MSSTAYELKNKNVKKHISKCCLLPRADMSSLDLETRKWNIHTEELLGDGEIHRGAGLDGPRQGHFGRDGDGGPSVELQRVRQHSQLVDGSWLGRSLCDQEIISGKYFYNISQLTAKSILQLFHVKALGRNKSGSR